MPGVNVKECHQLQLYRTAMLDTVRSGVQFLHPGSLATGCQYALYSSDAVHDVNYLRGCHNIHISGVIISPHLDNPVCSNILDSLMATLS